MIRPELMADGQLKVDMGAPFLTPETIPTTLMVDDGLPKGVLMLEGAQLDVAAVGMGNPHVVVPVDDLATIPFDAGSAEHLRMLLRAVANFARGGIKALQKGGDEGERLLLEALQNRS